MPTSRSAVAAVAVEPPPREPGLRDAVGGVRPEQGAQAPRPRIAFYSHDTLGLGHARRNLLLAQTLASSPLEPLTLSIVGKPAAARFPLPKRGERLLLPGLRKTGDGRYLAASLDLPVEEVVALRSRTIRAAIESFRPDLFVVDNVPRGALRELDETLAMLRTDRHTKIVLGLRDVLDEPEAIRRQWTEANAYSALRDVYDQIWIYGDRTLFDAPHDYWFPEDVLPKIRFTGYFDLRERLRYAPSEELHWAERQLPDAASTVVCLMGGGEDGAALATAFAGIRLPAGISALAVRGPHLPDPAVRRLERRAEADAAFRTLEFVREPMALVRGCRAVIAMGGYNTVWETLALERPLLVVPRVAPRKEQWIRAARLGQLGLLDVLRPTELDADALSGWLAAQDGRPKTAARSVVAFDGLARVEELAGELLGRPLARAANR